MELPDQQDICRLLADLHVRLNAIRPNPAHEYFLPGATVFMRPGQDNPFPSSAANRVLVYDPSAAPLLETAAAAKSLFDQHGVHHWFLEIGPGVDPGAAEAVIRGLGARVWPHVRYPILARRPGDTPPVSTSLTIRRIGADESRTHASDIDSIWGRPGASEALIAATQRPGYEAFAGFDGARVVAMGLLIHAGGPGGAGYVASGGTHADFRRRGGQSAIIAERVRCAQSLGLDLCVSETVLTDPTSTRNLLRAGFKIVAEWLVLEIGRAETSPAQETTSH